MELTSVKGIKEILKKNEIKPLKKFGQNFLINKNVLEDFVGTAQLNKNDVVLEIGPGLGTLTQELAKKAKEVIAIEKDRNIIELLKENLKDFNNIEIIQEDILKIKKIDIKNYKIVANLPFYLTAPVIRKFLELENPPKEMILIIQKEVAQRICSTPPRMSILSVSVQFYAVPKIISLIPKENFWPQPKVDSAIIKITPHQLYSNIIRSHFFRVVKVGFSQPRKQIINNLSNLLLDKEKTKKWLLSNNIKLEQRAETLSVKDWVGLTKTLPK